ncbi:YlbG family protein [Virgibacillus sp. JSM 102003]|uniref:YlbG family protein n=1 Tax=Virgibacillus sp. JSM 102003 TaxID=1562108 RepID=UPI0035BF99CC
MITKRQGLIVWFQHMKNLKQIKRYGHLIYSSRKLKYAVIYVDQEELEMIETKLLKLSFVSKIDRSYKPFIRTNYENAKPDKAKQYDYKMGI